MDDEYIDRSGKEHGCQSFDGDPGMIASANGMRARDPWEMERPRVKTPAELYGEEIANAERGPIETIDLWQPKE